MFWLILIAISCILVYKKFKMKYSYWKDLNIPYVNPAIPFGNFKDVVTLKMSSGEFVKEMYDKTREKVIGVWILWMPYLIIRDPQLINAVLVKDYNYFSDRVVSSGSKTDPICSKMLFFLSNLEWKNVRSKFSTRFSTAKLKAMTPLIKEVGEDFENYLFDSREEKVEGKELGLKFATDIVMSAMFGIKGNSFSKDNCVFYSFSRKVFGASFMNAIRFIVYFFLPEVGKYLRISFVNPQITRFLRRIIWQTLRAREISNEKRNDIIDYLIQLRRSKIDVHGDGNGFEGDRVVAIPIQMFVAGIDTTASILGFALHELALHQDVQEKLREEMKTTLSYHEQLSYEAVQDMGYLNKVITETLRKYPVLPYIDRIPVVDYQLPNTDYVIKKGVPIYIPLLGIHYDPEYYPNPHVFDPERFSKENVAMRKENVYLPFGNGPKQCVGKRFGILGAKLGLIHALRDFRIVKCDETVPVVFDPQGGLLTAKDGLWMKFESIKD